MHSCVRPCGIIVPAAASQQTAPVQPGNDSPATARPPFSSGHLAGTARPGRSIYCLRNQCGRSRSPGVRTPATTVPDSVVPCMDALVIARLHCPLLDLTSSPAGHACSISCSQLLLPKTRVSRVRVHFHASRLPKCPVSVCFLISRPARHT